jgi:hypothetical protein
MVNLMCYLLGTSNSVQSREFPIKRAACTFVCNCPFDTDWQFCVNRKANGPWPHVKVDSCLISCNYISKMASLFRLQDVGKLSDILQSFCFQIIIKKMRNPFEMSAFHVERSGEMEIYRRRRTLEELSDRSNRRPWLSFQGVQNSSIDIFKRASAGARSVTQIGTMQPTLMQPIFHPVFIECIFVADCR